MTRVTATEFKNNIGTYSDAAMRAPVIITRAQAADHLRARSEPV